ncbi:MAG: Bax inhibitor-1/YccA family protein [Eubacterium sp.]|nr:Bax inhibitor-1/YccA family protein [Eubacterium sp.]
MADYFDPNNNGSYNPPSSQYQSNPQGYDPQQQMYQQQMYQQSMNRGAFNVNQPQYAPGQAYGGAVAADVNDVLTKSFLFMFLALLVTGITSLAVAQSSFWISVKTSPAMLIVFAVLEIACVIGAGFAMKSNNLVLSAVLFGAYSILNGVTLSIIFLAYELGSIVQVFFIAAAIFGAMAVIGATTKKDLSNLGMICIIGLFGIIIASIVNFFLKSPGMDYVISIIGVVIFTGLTAYDVQKIKKLAATNVGYHPMVLGLYGAMELYLDFINLFLYLLRILGKAKN